MRTIEVLGTVCAAVAAMFLAAVCFAPAVGAGEFKKEYNYESEFYYGDDTGLEAVIRANPGLVLIQNSVVKGKWSHRDIPEWDEFKEEFPELNTEAYVKRLETKVQEYEDKIYDLEFRIMDLEMMMNEDQ